MTAAENRLLYTTPRMMFDTRVGITQKIEEEGFEKAIKEIVHLRKLYWESGRSDKLLEYVVNGEYLLTREGTINKILGEIKNKEKLPAVVIVDDFREITQTAMFVTDEVNIDAITM